MDIQLEAFEWRGSKRFRCPDCEFDGPTVPGVLKHWLESHKPQEAMAGPTLFDSEERPIERTIYAHGFELPNFVPGTTLGESADAELHLGRDWDNSSDRE